MKDLFKWNSSKRPRWVVIKIRTARILVKNEKEKKDIHISNHLDGPQGNYPEWEKAHLERRYATWFHLYVTVVQSLSRVRLFATPWTVALDGYRLPVLHYLLELAQIHVHWIGDAIQPSHPLLSPSPPAFNLSQHGPQWVGSSHQVAKGLELQLQPQSFQWIFSVFRMDWLDLLAV